MSSDKYEKWAYSLDGHGAYSIDTVAGGAQICYVRRLDRARLIAAAPDLLEALEECRNELKAVKAAVGFRAETLTVIKSADKAIARARGES